MTEMWERLGHASSIPGAHPAESIVPDRTRTCDPQVRERRAEKCGALRGVGGIRCALPPYAASGVRLGLSPLGLAADGGDRDVTHRRVGLGAMPMAFAGLDVHDIADIDLFLFVLGRHHAGTRGHDQDLVAGMGMPTRRAALAEVHHAAVVVSGVAGLDDGLARPRHRPRPAFDPLGTLDRDIRDVFKRDNLHRLSPSCWRCSKYPN